MLSRTFKLRNAEGDVEDLLVSFGQPTESEEDVWSVVCQLRSRSWSRDITFHGVDSIQAVCIGLKCLPAFFERECRERNFAIWFLDEGDVFTDTFWFGEPTAPPDRE